MIADDLTDLSATDDAFEVLYLVAAKRLRAGRLTVVDATSVQPHARAEVVRVARAHGVPAVAIVLDLPVPVCWERARTRTGRPIARRVLARQHRDLRRSLPGLVEEGFARVYVLTGTEQIDAAHVSIEDSS